MQMVLKEKVEACITQISTIIEESNKKIQEIREQQNAAVKPYNDSLENIKHRYESLVLEEARKDGRVPKSRSGQELSVDEVLANSWGLSLSWYDNETGRTDYYTLSWDEIEDLEKENAHIK